MTRNEAREIARRPERSTERVLRIARNLLDLSPATSDYELSARITNYLRAHTVNGR